jgi:hypothetical protein
MVNAIQEMKDSAGLLGNFGHSGWLLKQDWTIEEEARLQGVLTAF